MGHTPSIIPDITLIYQLGIFFATFFVLKYLVFKPYLKLFQMREEKTSGLMNRARDSREQAEKLKNDYESFMQKERKSNSAWADEQRRSIAKDEKQILEEARKEAGVELQGLRDNVNRDLEQAQSELAPQVAEFSSEIASHLLGYKVEVSKRSAAKPSSTKPEQTVPG